eukprot:6481410-Amphidinium_carterae.1
MGGSRAQAYRFPLQYKGQLAKPRPLSILLRGIILKGALLLKPNTTACEGASSSGLGKRQNLGPPEPAKK